jgi:anti-sigma factor RsiW
MKNQIKPRDYELLSAYLDNQINSKDRAYLENRLKAIPELQKELHELSKTRLLLRSMPKLRAPHNYIISVKTAQVNQRLPATSRMAPVMGIMSAVATILLVLVIFSGNVLTPASPRIETSIIEAPVQSSEVEQEALQGAELSPTTTEAAPMAMMEAAPVSSPEPTTAPALEMGAPAIVP